MNYLAAMLMNIYSEADKLVDECMLAELELTAPTTQCVVSTGTVSKIYIFALGIVLCK